MGIAGNRLSGMYQLAYSHLTIHTITIGFVVETEQSCAHIGIIVPPVAPDIGVDKRNRGIVLQGSGPAPQYYSW